VERRKMWKRLDKSGERELKMHPAMPRENARRAILYPSY